MAERPLFKVDFNELIDLDEVLLSQGDIKKDVHGNDVQLFEGLPIAIYDDDIGVDGQPENLVAEGFVTRNTATVHFAHVKWCCRITAYR
jgi:hypothetical protein